MASAALSPERRPDEDALRSVFARLTLPAEALPFFAEPRFGVVADPAGFAFLAMMLLLLLSWTA
jgi:hypothetical protein